MEIYVYAGNKSLRWRSEELFVEIASSGSLITPPRNAET